MKKEEGKESERRGKICTARNESFLSMTNGGLNMTQRKIRSTRRPSTHSKKNNKKVIEKR